MAPAFANSASKALVVIFASVTVLSTAPPLPGLALTGAYSTPGGLSIWFYPDSAIVTCNQIKGEAGYAVELRDNQMRVKLLPSKRVGLLKINEDLLKLLPQSSNRDEWQKQRVVF